jgi:hypothetical protein
MLALALAVSLCHYCAASCFLTTRRVFLPRVVFSYHALLVIASRVSQTHVGNLQYKNAMASGDNRAAVINVGVGVGGVALPQLRSVVFSYHASCFLTTRRVSYHASSFLTTRCWLLLRECLRHIWEIYNTGTQSRSGDNRATVTIAQR